MSRARNERGAERLIQLVYGFVYGDLDPHTHIRWRAIRRRVEQRPSTVDVACGDGTITLEIADRMPAMIIRGVDVNERAIERAEQRRRDIGRDNVSFEVCDVADVDLGTVDQALLLDVMEHVEDDVGLLTDVSRAVKPGGRIVVSTPTPAYPRFFGREFHEAVGHVRDGYTLAELSTLVEEAGFTVESAEHYTRLPGSIACAPFYRFLWKKGRLGIALSPLLNAVSFLDYVWPWTTGSSSVLVAGVKN